MNPVLLQLTDLLSGMDQDAVTQFLGTVEEFLTVSAAEAYITDGILTLTAPVISNESIPSKSNLLAVESFLIHLPGSLHIVYIDHALGVGEKSGILIDLNEIIRTRMPWILDGVGRDIAAVTKALKNCSRSNVSFRNFSDLDVISPAAADLLEEKLLTLSKKRLSAWDPAAEWNDKWHQAFREVLYLEGRNIMPKSLDLIRSKYQSL